MSKAVDVNCSNAAPVTSACNLAEAAAQLRAVSKSMCEVADYLTLQAANASSPTELQHQIVKLNVGGVRFETSAATLRSQPGSFFDALLSNRWNSEFNPDKVIFIDRDGSLFHHVVNFLRDGSLPVDQMSPEEVVCLKIEADFFGLPELAACFNPKAPKLTFRHIGKSLVVEDEGRVLKPGGGKFTCVDEWRFATAAPALPESKTTLLQLHIRHVQNLNFFVGLSQDPNTKYLSSRGVFGWNQGYIVWNAGVENSCHADDAKFQDGDVMVLKVDRENAVLSMRIKRLACKMTLSIPGIPTSGPLYLLVGFYHNVLKGSVELQPDLDPELLF